MKAKKGILLQIIQRIRSVEPDAKIILYGSFARGEEKKDSDIDLLILLNKKKVTFQDEKRISFPLYDLEFDSGQIISPVILSISDWNDRHSVTPFYKNIQKEGVEL
jgi:predicted nucleotidyltransferase